MKVMLNEYVQNLGDPGDLVEVAAGYARNYLVPQKLAFEATAANIKTHENNLKQRARKIAKFLKAAEEKKTRLEGAGDLVFVRKAGDEGKLFGSVTNADIEAALIEKGFEVEKKKISLDKPIKHLGEAVAKIRIHATVTAQVKVVVQPEISEEPPAEPEAAPPESGETETPTEATTDTPADTDSEVSQDG